MTDFFGITSGTVSNWSTGKFGLQRKLLFEVLQSLPIEYIKERARMVNIDIEKLKENPNKK